ncbi:MAG: NAD(P)/FAD-dependent oxidoreductase [Cyclobacteriaceae bacterium]
MPAHTKKVAIIGGGLAGLITAYQLARCDVEVTVFERKRFPFHRVCGEYISNETLPFLRRLGLFPEELRPSVITRFELTSTNGKKGTLPLDLGGFGISRFSFDHWLVQKARAAGASIQEGVQVEEIVRQEGCFEIRISNTTHPFEIVVGSFGKRSKLDRQLHRPFIDRSSPYVGVKYHIRNDHPKDLIALHNFKNGYCGISRVEDGIVNLCYLTHRSNLKEKGSISEMESTVLHQNPHLKGIFEDSDFLFEKPEVINEISFETKAPIEDHIFMAGDAAGMIAPLCGNGMAMAIHSSKLLAEQLIPLSMGKISQREAEKAYVTKWKNHFTARLWAGRKIQSLFGSAWQSDLAVGLINHTPPLARYLVSKTHGQAF